MGLGELDGTPFLVEGHTDDGERGRARRHVEQRKLWHRPDRRQCGLASLTSITWHGDRIVTVTYSEPAGAAARRPGAGA